MQLFLKKYRWSLCIKYRKISTIHCQRKKTRQNCALYASIIHIKRVRKKNFIHICSYKNKEIQEGQCWGSGNCQVTKKLGRFAIFLLIVSGFKPCECITYFKNYTLPPIKVFGTLQIIRNFNS